MEPPKRTPASFKSLPVELRLKIYGYMYSSPRTVTLYYDKTRDVFLTTTPNPSILTLNKEARTEALKLYEKAFSRTKGQEHSLCPPAIYVDFDRDVIYLEPLPWLTSLTITVDSEKDCTNAPQGAALDLALMENQQKTIQSLSKMRICDRLGISILAVDDNRAFRSHQNFRLNLSGFSGLQRVSVVNVECRGWCAARPCGVHFTQKELNHLFMDSASLKGVWQGRGDYRSTTTDDNGLPIIASDRFWRIIKSVTPEKEEQIARIHKGKEPLIIHDITSNQVHHIRHLLQYCGRFSLKKD